LPCRCRGSRITRSGLAHARSALRLCLTRLPPLALTFVHLRLRLLWFILVRADFPDAHLRLFFTPHSSRVSSRSSFSLPVFTGFCSLVTFGSPLSTVAFHYQFTAVWFTLHLHTLVYTCTQFWFTPTTHHCVHLHRLLPPHAPLRTAPHLARFTFLHISFTFHARSRCMPRTHFTVGYYASSPYICTRFPPFTLHTHHTGHTRACLTLFSPEHLTLHTSPARLVLIATLRSTTHVFLFTSRFTVCITYATRMFVSFSFHSYWLQHVHVCTLTFEVRTHTAHSSRFAFHAWTLFTLHFGRLVRGSVFFVCGLPRANALHRSSAHAHLAVSRLRFSRVLLLSFTPFVLGVNTPLTSHHTAFTVIVQFCLHHTATFIHVLTFLRLPGLRLHTLHVTGYMVWLPHAYTLAHRLRTHAHTLFLTGLRSGLPGLQFTLWLRYTTTLLPRSHGWLGYGSPRHAHTHTTFTPHTVAAAHYTGFTCVLPPPPFTPLPCTFHTPHTYHVHTRVPLPLVFARFGYFGLHIRGSSRLHTSRLVSVYLPRSFTQFTRLHWLVHVRVYLTHLPTSRFATRLNAHVLPGFTSLDRSRTTTSRCWLRCTLLPARTVAHLPHLAHLAWFTTFLRFTGPVYMHPHRSCLPHRLRLPVSSHVLPHAPGWVGSFIAVSAQFLTAGFFYTTRTSLHSVYGLIRGYTVAFTPTPLRT